MIKMLTRLTVLSIILVFGGIGQSEVDAAAGMPGGNKQQNINEHNKAFNYDSFFKNIKFDWQNGKFIIEKQPELENEVPQTTPNYSEENKSDQEEVTETPKTENDSDNESLNQFEREVFELTNIEREKQGLAPLQVDGELSKVAREKSRDMAVNGYFDHNSPTYGSPFDMMREYGISYHTAGENIAKGQRSPEEVVNAWMNSQGHRENILNGNFTHIGVGYVEQGNVWTQQFIGK